MTRAAFAVLTASLFLGLTVGSALALVILPRADIGAEAAVEPGAQRVNGWDEAMALAGVPLLVPGGDGDPSTIVVHGVPGDATRPVEARFGEGLVVLQAHRDLLPPENTGELVSVPAADDGWWQSATDGRRLAVRFGDTLALLWGRSDTELVAIARAMRPIGSTP